MSQFFKRIAIAAGAGLAVAFASVSSGPVRKRQDPVPEAEPEVAVSSRIPHAGDVVYGIQDDDVLYLEPLFDRLEAIEHHLEREARKAPAPQRLELPPSPPPPVDLSPVYAQLDALRQELPGLISAIVQEQLDVVGEQKSEPEPEVTETSSQERIAEAVALAVNERFGGLEGGLRDHATLVVALNERVNQTDANLQRLVAVISRLVEGPGLNPAVQQTPRGAHAAASFEAHLSDAMNGEPVPPEPAPREFEAGPNPEPEGETPRPRLPMSRIF